MKLKKLLAISLSLLLMLTVLPIIEIGTLTALAETSGTTGECTWVLNGTELTISGNGDMENCSFLESPWGTNITKVTINDGVTSIGDYAFYDCTSLTSVTIPDSVKSISENAFYGTEYRENTNNWENDVLYIGKHLIAAKTSISGSYTIKSGTLTIADSAFYNCTSLTSVTIPDSVESLGNSAFYNCTSLTSVTIPDSVESLGNSAFDNCTSLTDVTIGNGVTSIGYYAFCNTGYYNNTNNWENNVLYIGKYLIEAKTSISGSYTIKSGTLTIADFAFYICESLTDVTIGNGVTSIGEYAFYNCTSLTSVTIPNSVTIIDYFAFDNCTSLETVYFTGTEEQWNKISIGSYNSDLTNANIVFNYVVEHNHTGGTATCKAKAKCSVCGASYGSLAGHKYSNATCTAPKTCTVCKQTSGKALGHDYKTTKTTKATTKKKGTIYKACTRCKKPTTTTINYAKTVKLSATSYTYNGKVKKPTVSVKDSTGKTISTSNYTVTYASGRKNVGKYKVTVKFKGNYSGTKYLYFTINPVKTTVKSLTAGKKSLKVSITKKSTQVTGYQIQYATNKSFKSAKTKTISYKTTSTTLKSLSAKKTYYVRVRTYKTVNGKKYYSGWSTIKYKKTK